MICNYRSAKKKKKMAEQEKTNCTRSLSFFAANSKTPSRARTHFTYTPRCLLGLYGHTLHHKTQILHSLLFVSSNNPPRPPTPLC